MSEPNEEDPEEEEREKALMAEIKDLRKDDSEKEQIVTLRRKRSAIKANPSDTVKKAKYDMFEDNSDLENEEEPDEEGRKIIVRRDVDFDDDEHYYKAQENEILEKNFRVTGEIGRGVYGGVVKAEDLTSGKEYAIKILRSADLLTKSGERESAILKKLNDTDPFDKKHVVRMGGTFLHRKHLCLVLELLDMNLRDAIRVYGRRVGIS